MRSKDPRDPRDGIVLPDPRATAKKVRTRRIKRRLKAAVSLAIAAAAGTFIACKGGDDKRPNPPPNPTTDEVSNLPAPADAGAGPADAAADAAPRDAALVGPVDARKDGGVDRNEHRKGMPVRDNLLE